MSIEEIRQFFSTPFLFLAFLIVGQFIFDEIVLPIVNSFSNYSIQYVIWIEGMYAFHRDGMRHVVRT